MKQPKSYQPVWATLFALLSGWLAAEEASAQIYSRQYAVVIGINQYTHPDWPLLDYARGDAEGVAALMKELGFQVEMLVDSQATRSNIVSLLEDQIAPRLQKDDAVFFFFAGHGHTKPLGGQKWGYIIPVDATDKSASLLSMQELLTLSEKMGNAKHQLFVLDCCFSGLLGKQREGADGIPASHPYYLKEIGTRKAREILTAGSETQTVADGGPYGHSVFTGYFIQGIREGKADLNGDGWIAFNELAAYIQPAASQRNQTPGIRLLPGHEQGEFLFRVPATSSQAGLQPIRQDTSKQTRAVETNPQRLEHAPAPIGDSSSVYSLRALGRDNLSKEEVGQMLQANDFFAIEKSWNKTFRNKNGTGIKNRFRQLNQQNQLVAVDDATGLMWQQSGSPRRMTYSETEMFIRDLNTQRFAGYGNWRMPTLEEAMSLMEPTRNFNKQYTDMLFDPKQASIWSSDRESSFWVWFVDFETGVCSYGADGKYYNCVRAVRSVQ